VLVRGDRADIIRRAETQEDVFRRDIVPERLRRATVMTTDGTGGGMSDCTPEKVRGH
jgi:hypothetical protein